jgi:hypothetical protein
MFKFGPDGHFPFPPSGRVLSAGTTSILSDRNKSMANFNRPRDNYKRRMKHRRKEERRLSERCTTASVAGEKKEMPATKIMGGAE